MSSGVPTKSPPGVVQAVTGAMLSRFNHVVSSGFCNQSEVIRKAPTLTPTGPLNRKIPMVTLSTVDPMGMELKLQKRSVRSMALLSIRRACWVKTPLLGDRINPSSITVASPNIEHWTFLAPWRRSRCSGSKRVCLPTIPPAAPGDRIKSLVARRPSVSSASFIPRAELRLRYRGKSESITVPSNSDTAQWPPSSSMGVRIGCDERTASSLACAESRVTSASDIPSCRPS